MIGPDIWAFALDDQLLLRTTFSNFSPQDEYAHQAYPSTYPDGDHPARTGAFANNTLGYIWEQQPQDASYRLTFTFDHTLNDLEAVFSGLGVQIIEDESWGLDNIEVVVFP